MYKVLILFISLTKVMAAPLVIYGKDDRHEVYESSPKYQRIASSVAAQISKKEFQNNPLSSEYHFTKSKNLERRFDLQKNQKFATQQTRVGCSAFLVAPNIIATAGHCVQSSSDCDENYWVFDYILEAGKTKINSIPKSNVVSCKRIIITKLDMIQDFALIEINESQERPYLELESQVTEEENVYMLGFPSGLPMKVTNNAKILKIFDLFFQANLDAFSVNSGSPVLSETSDKVIGILVRGTTDYIHQDKSPNRIPNVCDDLGSKCLDGHDASGEDISRVNQFIEYLN